MNGTLGTYRGATPDILKGTTPIHAEPSKVSISRPSGINLRRASSSILQCMKSRSCHCIRMAQLRSGSAHIRSLAVCFSSTVVIGFSLMQYLLWNRVSPAYINSSKGDFFSIRPDFNTTRRRMVYQNGISLIPEKSYP